MQIFVVLVKNKSTEISLLTVKIVKKIMTLTLEKYHSNKKNQSNKIMLLLDPRTRNSYKDLIEQKSILQSNYDYI